MCFFSKITVNKVVNPRTTQLKISNQTLCQQFWAYDKVLSEDGAISAETCSRLLNTNTCILLYMCIMLVCYRYNCYSLTQFTVRETATFLRDKKPSTFQNNTPYGTITVRYVCACGIVSFSSLLIFHWNSRKSMG